MLPYFCIFESGTMHFARRRALRAHSAIMNPHVKSSNINPHVTSKFCSTLKIEISMLISRRVKKLPTNGRRKRLKTWSIIIIISPNRSWKEVITLCQRSTKAYNSGVSSIISKESINNNMPTSSTSVLTSHSIYIVNNFFNFKLWVRTFNGVQLCNYYIINHQFLSFNHWYIKLT